MKNIDCASILGAGVKYVRVKIALLLLPAEYLVQRVPAALQLPSRCRAHREDEQLFYNNE